MPFKNDFTKHGTTRSNFLDQTRNTHNITLPSFRNKNPMDQTF